MGKKEILAINFIVAICSIIYELVMANTLAIITNNHIWWQSVTIGFYLAGLGIGTSHAAKVKDKIKSLIFAELWLSVLGISCAIYVYFFHTFFMINDFALYVSNGLYTSSYVEKKLIIQIAFIVFVQGLTVLIGFFSGHEIPHIIDYLAEKFPHPEQPHQANIHNEENKVLAFNYFGTLVGTILLVYLLLPSLDIIYTTLLMGGINFCVFLYLCLRSKTLLPKPYLLLVLSFCGCFLLIAKYGQILEQYYLKTVFMFRDRIIQEKMNLVEYFKNIGHEKKIFRTKSHYQYIDIFHTNIAGKPSFILTLDTNFQFSSYNEGLYHEGFAHLPMQITNFIPQHVMVMGGGDGLLIRELLKYPQIQTITHIELDPSMVKLAKEYPDLVALNQNSLANPRVTTIYNDAFYYLRNNHQLFDAIFLDFPYPENFDIAKLFSVEFYRFVKRSLRPEGFIVMDIPIYPQEDYSADQYRGRILLTTNFDEDDIVHNSVITSTLHFAGMETIYPYRVDRESFILALPGKKELNFNVDSYDLSLFQNIKRLQLLQLKNQIFPHQINSKYINSVFHPTILQNDIGL